ncbi:MAG TPA: FAD-binding oxidoreductase [Candidatus Sumerlaeia bacterium]|nr:MAG: putative FAD-linked oxidoreductase [candidate division BRC1 bacterium ADurb.Bin183]HRR98682.1 FAD-binding oxidoreductase [Candidatus Sumerlaeia bacterium]
MELAEKRAGADSINAIRAIVGDERIRTAKADLYVYGFDAGMHCNIPDAVVRPRTAEEISQILKLANERNFAVVPRGAGTALCGHAIPIAGGVVLDLQGMNRIKEINPGDLLCVAEPGVVCDDLNAALKKYRFFIPGPASSEAATIGGMAATNASGDKALKYGAMRDYVLGMQAVMPTGEIVRFGTRTLKNASGYQMEKLFIGMEGTLGIITEITLKMAPLPEKTAACIAAFKELVEAGQTVSDIIAAPIFPAQLEIMSDICVKAVNKATGLGLPECGGFLLIACDGHPEQVKDEIRKVKEICEKNKAFFLDFTEDPKRIEELWKGRKQMLASLSVLKPEFSTIMLADDMAVPISKVPDAVKGFLEIQDKYDIYIPPYGHAGDGNLHTKVLLDTENPDHWHQAEKAVREIYDLVLRLGGTVTGEHGVAISKAEYFFIERADSIPFMRAIKRALDPNNILNPYKIFDWDKSFLHNLRYPVQLAGKEKAN